MSDDTVSTSMTQTSPDVHKWTDEYQQQGGAAYLDYIAADGAPAAAPADDGDPPDFLLPIMPLGKTKCPTETVQLQSERVFYLMGRCLARRLYHA